MPSDDVQYVLTDHTRTEQEACNHEREEVGVKAPFSLSGKHSSSSTPYVILLPLCTSSNPRSTSPPLPLHANEKERVGSPSRRLPKAHSRRMYALYEGLPHPGNNDPTCYLISLEAMRDGHSSPSMLLELQAQGPPQGFGQTFFIGEDRVVPQVSTLIASPVDLHFMLLRILFDPDRCNHLPHALEGGSSGAASLVSPSSTAQEGYGPPRALPFRSAEEWLFPLLRGAPSPPCGPDTTRTHKEGEMVLEDSQTGHHRWTGRPLPFHDGISQVVQEDTMQTGGEGEEEEEEEPMYDDGESFFQHLRARSAVTHDPTRITERPKDHFPFAHGKRARDNDHTSTSKEEGKETGWWKRWLDAMQDEGGDSRLVAKESMVDRCVASIGTRSCTGVGNPVSHLFQRALPSLLEDFCETTTFVPHSPSVSSFATPSKGWVGDGHEKEAHHEEATQYFQPSWVKAAFWVARRVRAVQRSTALRTFLQLPPLPPVRAAEEEAAKTPAENADGKRTAIDDANPAVVSTPHKAEEGQRTTGWEGRELCMLQKAALGLVSEYIPSSFLHHMRCAVKAKMERENTEGHVGAAEEDGATSGLWTRSTPSCLEWGMRGGEKKRNSVVEVERERMTYVECWALLQDGDPEEAHTQGRNHSSMRGIFTNEEEEEKARPIGTGHHHSEWGVGGPTVENRGSSDTSKKPPPSLLLPSLRRLEKEGKPKGTPTLDAFFFSPSASKTTTEKKEGKKA